MAALLKMFTLPATVDTSFKQITDALVGLAAEYLAVAQQVQTTTLPQINGILLSLNKLADNLENIYIQKFWEGVRQLKKELKKHRNEFSELISELNKATGNVSKTVLILQQRVDGFVDKLEAAVDQAKLTFESIKKSADSVTMAMNQFNITTQKTEQKVAETIATIQQQTIRTADNIEAASQTLQWIAIGVAVVVVIYLGHKIYQDRNKNSKE